MAKLPANIKHVINYLRRSRQDVEREKRTGEDTLHEQKSLMDRVLSSYDGITYEQRFEIGSGDKIETRPVFKEIIEDMRSRKFDAIAVKEISRLGRGSYTDMGTIYDLIQDNRIHIITPYKVYDPGNPSDLRQIRFELFLSREEFETIRERMLGAKYGYAMSGKWMSAKTPYGYSFDKESQKLVPNDDAAIVKLIFDLYANGLDGREMGYRSIAVYLRRLGVLTPQSRVNWVQMGIKRVLTNSAYIGQVKYRQRQKKDGVVSMRPESEWIVVDDAHEPIIDKETFEKVSSMMSKGKPSTRVDFSALELAGVVTCGACGYKMIRHARDKSWTNKDGSVTKRRIEHLYCPRMPSCVSVLYRDVETAILVALDEITNLSDEDYIEFAKDSLPTVDPVITKEEIRSRLNERRRKVELALDTLVTMREEMEIDADTYKRRRAKRNEELQEITTELDKLDGTFDVDTDTPSFDVQASKKRLKTGLEVYNNTVDTKRKNTILRGMLHEVNIYSSGQTIVGRKKNLFSIDIRLSDGVIFGGNV